MPSKHSWNHCGSLRRDDFFELGGHSLPGAYPRAARGDHERSPICTSPARAVFRLDGRNGWKKYVKGRLEIIPVEAEHTALMKEPTVQSVVSRINEILCDA